MYVLKHPLWLLDMLSLENWTKQDAKGKDLM